MSFAGEMSGWWWFYWRLYDTIIPLDGLDETFGNESSKAQRLLRACEHAGLAVR
jgi:hypothetical protein